MAQSLKMPALGESVTEGTVTAWLKQVGDTIEIDEPIVEVATDKVDSEVPSPVAGVLLEILVQEDETVDVGTELALIGEPSAGGAPASPAAPEPAVAPEPVATPGPVATTPEPTAPAADAGETTDLKMPALGESVTEGTVTAWLKQVGDAVEADESVVEVATDKVDSEVPSPVSGFITELLVQEDDTVDVGTVIARISTSATAPAAPAAAAPAAPTATPAPLTPPAAPAAAASVSAPSRPVVPPAPPAPPAAPSWARPTTPAEEKVTTTIKEAAGRGTPVTDSSTASDNRVYVTPLVRKLAREKGIALDQIVGTGVGGRIRKEDIEAAAAAQAAASSSPAVTAAPTAKPTPDPLRGTTEKMSRLRQTISRRMVESLQTAAQLTTVIEVDVTKVVQERARYKDQFQEVHDTKLPFLPFFVKAATEALVSHPKINATINGNEVTYFDYENVGIAVDAPRGLMVPVIKNAGDLDILGISQAINTLAQKTREGKIGPDELTGGTFTITNTGSGGALFDTPVLNLPEVAIMGVGTIVKRPMVTRDADGNEAIGVRSMVYLSLTYDHRLVDGADASRYLMTVKRRLEEGSFSGDLGL